LYLVHTIGGLGGVEAPVHVAPPKSPADAGTLVGIGVAGVVLGAVGFWVFVRATKGRR